MDPACTAYTNMSTTPYNFLLNTESYDPLFDLVERLTKTVQKNGDIIGRLTDVVDAKFAYPLIPDEESAKKEAQDEQAKGESADEAKASTTGPDESRDDFLRHHLDETLQLKQIEVTQFDNVENRELRQLLIDNFRLMKVRDGKRRFNGELLRIYKTYEELLMELVLPQLAQDVNNYNVECIQRMKTEELETKLSCDAGVWLAYSKYLEQMEKAKQVTELMLQVMADSLQNDELERLELQLMILEELTWYIKSGKLQRAA